MTFFPSFFDNLNTKHIILLFFTLGMIIYANSLFNSFVGDDFAQVRNNQSVHSIWNIPSLFTKGAFSKGAFNENAEINYYKPLLSSTFALIYFFSRENPLGFHLIQILIHITNSVLIYLIFRYFFRLINFYHYAKFPVLYYCIFSYLTSIFPNSHLS